MKNSRYHNRLKASFVCKYIYYKARFARGEIRKGQFFTQLAKFNCHENHIWLTVPKFNSKFAIFLYIAYLLHVIIRCQNTHLSKRRY